MGRPWNCYFCLQFGLGFVLRKFAPAIGQMISDKVRSGSLIYMGRTQGLREVDRAGPIRNASSFADVI